MQWCIMPSTATEWYFCLPDQTHNTKLKGKKWNITTDTLPIVQNEFLIVQIFLSSLYFEPMWFSKFVSSLI